MPKESEISPFLSPTELAMARTRDRILLSVKDYAVSGLMSPVKWGHLSDAVMEALAAYRDWRDDLIDRLAQDLLIDRVAKDLRGRVMTEPSKPADDLDGDPRVEPR